MTMRVDGGVSLHVQFMADAAGAAAEVARPARAGASGAAPSAPSTWTNGGVLNASPRSGIWLIPDGRIGIAIPRAGYAPAVAAAEVPSAKATETASAKATVTSPLDFLRDSRLSAEEKLVLLLAQQQKDVEKEIETVLKKAEAKSAQKKSGGSSGGLLKGLNPMNIIKSALPGLNLMETFGLGKVVDGVLEMTGKALSELTGPMLAAGATALGMPHLAPLAMSVGSRLADAAVAFDGALSAGDAKATANAPNAGTGSSNALDPVETQRLTLLVNRQQQWAGTVSNLLHSTHQTRMSIIQNLR
jgi:hypothetical protein